MFLPGEYVQKKSQIKTKDVEGKCVVGIKTGIYLNTGFFQLFFRWGGVGVFDFFAVPLDKALATFFFAFIYVFLLLIFFLFCFSYFLFCFVLRLMESVGHSMSFNSFLLLRSGLLECFLLLL